MQFSVTILGSNSALPAFNRFPSAQIINTGSRLLLIDCGEGTQIQMNRFRIRRNKIDAIFISHLHGDHIFGLPGLLASFNHFRREEKIEVYGPKGIKDILNVTLGYTGNPLNFPLIIKEFDSSVSQRLYDVDEVSVHTIPLNHRIPCAGFIVRKKEGKRKLDGDKLEEFQVPNHLREDIRSGSDFESGDGKLIPNEVFTSPGDPPAAYAYISDTIFDKSIVPAIKGVDLLYHEATFADDLADMAELTKHSTTKQAGQIAKLAEVGKLVIGHFSSRYQDLQPLLDEAREVFENTELAVEGREFLLTPY